MITPVAVGVTRDRSIYLVSSGSVRVCVCEIDPDASTVRSLIGLVAVAGATSIRYHGSRANTHRDVVVARVWFLRSDIVSGDIKNEPEANLPSVSTCVDPDAMSRGDSPDLTRQK
jgi:hypothetical protein